MKAVGLKVKRNKVKSAMHRAKSVHSKKGSVRRSETEYAMEADASTQPALSTHRGEGTLYQACESSRNQTASHMEEDDKIEGTTGGFEILKRHLKLR